MARLARGLERQRADVERLFAAELDALAPAERSELLDALSSAVSPSTWEYLRSSRGLSLPRARAVVVRMLRAVLADAGVPLHGASAS